MRKGEAVSPLIRHAAPQDAGVIFRGHPAMVIRHGSGGLRRCTRGNSARGLDDGLGSSASAHDRRTSRLVVSRQRNWGLPIPCSSTKPAARTSYEDARIDRGRVAKQVSVTQDAGSILAAACWDRIRRTVDQGDGCPGRMVRFGHGSPMRTATEAEITSSDLYLGLGQAPRGSFVAAHIGWP